jgi:hypothetical protein
MTDAPHSTLSLRLDPTIPKKDLAKIRDNFSAAVLDGNHLWLGGDEGTSIDRVSREADGNFAGHTRIDLAAVLPLPGGGQEVDIEGMDVDGGYLWLIGSHSLKRKKAEADKTPAENIKRLASVSADGNRFMLARVPIDASGTPVDKAGALTAARLQGDAQGNLLTEALKKDDHIGPFARYVTLPGGTIHGIPSKDNGLDVEGLAVSGNRVFLGLRGPVLRGWAVVIELQVSDHSSGFLGLQELGSSGAVLRRHFLQLDGLGLRDLIVHGNDLLILAGPTMDLDGPVFIYRWGGALEHSGDSLTFGKDLQRLVSVPFGLGTDHAEALTLVPGGGLMGLVCYDSPGKARIKGPQDNELTVDVFKLDPS